MTTQEKDTQSCKQYSDVERYNYYYGKDRSGNMPAAPF